MGGDDPDDVEGYIETALERDVAFNSNEVEDFSHLDDKSREFQQEYFEAQQSQAQDGYLSHLDDGDR